MNPVIRTSDAISSPVIGLPCSAQIPVAIPCSPVAVYESDPGEGFNDIAVSHSRGMARIYLNGLLVNTGEISPRPPEHAPGSFGGGTCGHFPGTIDPISPPVGYPIPSETTNQSQP